MYSEGAWHLFATEIAHRCPLILFMNDSTVVRAEAGTRIVPALYSTTGGLVEGTPFTLCDADGAACDAAGKLRLTKPVDSRIKRPSADVGRDVLAQR